MPAMLAYLGDAVAEGRSRQQGGAAAARVGAQQHQQLEGVAADTGTGAPRDGGTPEWVVIQET